MPRLSCHFIVRAALTGALLHASGTLAAEPVVLEGGQSLTQGGMSADGKTLLTIRDSAEGCWILKILTAKGSRWTTTTEGREELPEEGECGPSIATLSQDGRRVLLAEHAEGRYTVMRADPGGFAVEAELTPIGSKGFEHPPPPAVAVANNGSLALVGAPNYDCTVGFPAARCGVAFLYERDGVRWKHAASLRYPEPRIFNVDFGTVAALSDDGMFAVAGGQGHAGDPGVLYVYGRQGDAWPLLGPLSPDSRDEGAFGQSVAINGNGSLIAVGGDQSVYIFAAQAGSHRRVDKLVAPNEAGGFGISLALSASGDTLIVGAPRSFCRGEPRCGSVYIYTYRDGRFRLEGQVEQPTPVPRTDFGHVIATDADASVVAIQGHRPYVFTR